MRVQRGKCEVCVGQDHTHVSSSILGIGLTEMSLAFIFFLAEVTAIRKKDTMKLGCVPVPKDLSQGKLQRVEIVQLESFRSTWDHLGPLRIIWVQLGSSGLLGPFQSLDRQSMGD